MKTWGAKVWNERSYDVSKPIHFSYTVYGDGFRKLNLIF